MNLELLETFGDEPLTLEETKNWIKVEYDEDDDLISSLITAARQYAETHQKRSLVAQRWRLGLNTFPCEPCIKLPRPKLLSVESVTWLGQEMSEEDYLVDTASEPGQICATSGQWPIIDAQQALLPNNILIEFTSGNFSMSTKQAMLFLIAHWYSNRAGVVVGSISKTLEFTVDALLNADSWGFYA